MFSSIKTLHGRPKHLTAACLVISGPTTSTTSKVIVYSCKGKLGLNLDSSAQ